MKKSNASTRENDKVISAVKVKSLSYKDPALREYIDEILAMISDDVKKSIEEKRTISTTELPIHFVVDNMDYIRARKHIYYHIVQLLKNNGYRPKLDIKGSLTNMTGAYLHLTWFTEEDAKYEEHVEKCLNEHIVKKNHPIRKRRGN